MVVYVGSVIIFGGGYVSDVAKMSLSRWVYLCCGGV